MSSLLDDIGYFVTSEQRLLAASNHVSWNKASDLLYSFNLPKPVIFVFSESVEMRWDHLAIYTFSNRPTIIIKVVNDHWVEGSITDLGKKKEKGNERLD